MATGGSSGQIGIQEKDHHFMRVLKALTSQGSFTLLQVLKWGCPAKTDLQTYKEYLIASGMSRTDYKKVFDIQQQKKILRNPSGDQYDLTLLYKMIQRACHSLAPFGDDVWFVPDDTKLEYLLTCIKNSRNDLMHDLPVFTQDTMRDNIENIKQILTKLMQKSGTLYSVDIDTVDHMIHRINDNLNNIRDQPFAPVDLHDYSNRLLFENLKDLLRVSGAKELKQKYGSKTSFNPLYLLDKHECHLKVASVFVRPAIEDNKDGRLTTSVHFTKLLEHLNTTTPDSLMILEGQPGVGKTTLLRFYVDAWIAGGGDIKGLSDYDLVLHFECRDTTIDSFTKLLSHMPKTTSKIQKNDLLDILLSLKVLVLVDGLDELNETSRKALKEILNFKSSYDFTLICTTRPERIPELHLMVSGRMKVVNMIIQGIPIQEREKFVQEYHNKLKQHGVIVGLDINGLLEYLRQVPPHLQDFLRFPLNLVMLTFLWDDPNSRVRDIASTTALYLEAHNLLIKKLHERLMNQPSTKHMSLTDLTTKCDTFLAYMYMEALRAQAHDVVFLNKGQIKDLNELCKSLHLPAEEIFSAFLVSASIDCSLTHSKVLKFPHKSLQDFYAANFLTFLLVENLVPDDSMYKRKCDESNDYSKQQIVKRTQESLGRHFSIRSVLVKFNKDQAETQHFEKYSNIIFQLVYLLHNSDPNTLAHYAGEVVTLLDAGKYMEFEYWAAGKHMQFEHWADLLKESQYNQTLAQKISKVLSTGYWRVEDQHVKAVAVFLSYNCPSRLHIIIMNDPMDVPGLHDLMETVAKTVAATRKCEITIEFNHHWLYPESGLSNSQMQKLVSSRERDSRPVLLSSTNSQDDLSSDCIRSLCLSNSLLQKLVCSRERDSRPASLSSTNSQDDLPSDCIRFTADTVSDDPRSRIVEIRGHFNGDAINMLPTSLKSLHMVIADDHDARDWFKALPKLSETLSCLKDIVIHITPGVSPHLLPKLPPLKGRPILYLSNVDDNILWACEVSRALLPSNTKYGYVCLIHSSVSSDGVKQLAEHLSHLGVGVCVDGGLALESSHLINLSDSDYKSLKETVRHILKCDFYRLGQFKRVKIG